MLKLKMMLCVMMSRWSSSVAHQSSPSASEATTPPAWIMQLPRLADTAERDYFTPRERLITMQKTTGRNPEVY